MNDRSPSLRACPVCSSESGSLLYDNCLAPIGGLDMSYRVSECYECGFLYARELPSQNQYARYYQTLSKYDQISSINEVSSFDEIRADAAVALAHLHVEKNQAIADLGCGVGYLLSKFDAAGWHDLYGVDPAPYAPARAFELFNLKNVYQGLLSGAISRLPINRIGMVCLTAVLEHLWAPMSDISKLCSSLRPGTKLLIEVPALEGFVNHPCEPYGEFSLEHIQYFSARSLENFMRKAGATPICINILKLFPAATDSLLGIFEVGSVHEINSRSIAVSPDRHLIDGYINQSYLDQADIINKLTGVPGPWVIYGAGSHTARLLPILAHNELDGNIIGIVDNNVNLHGQAFGRWRISDPGFIASHPEAVIVISSFRAEASIRISLHNNFTNPLVTLYQ